MFGNGTRTYHNETARELDSGRRVATVFSNAQVAHVWAQLRQSFGKSGNGNLYFEGRALFSYGRHYTAGFILPAELRDTGDGRVSNAPRFELEGRGGFLIANTSRSVSTSGHVLDARSATRGILGVPSYSVAESVVSRVRELFELSGFRPAELAKRAESFLAQLAPEDMPSNEATAAILRAFGHKAPERVAAELETLRAALATAEEAAKAEARAAAQAKAEREAREREEAERLRPAREAEALADWRAGGPGRTYPAGGAAPVYMPRADAQGGAFIRAVGVTRGEGGRITGGTLQTSQGAEVPLTHALRVFAFLKACRDAGEGWQANGRTLRAGPFTVDSVGPDGSFRAGCHRFAWAEVAQLAEALGVFELAPADTTEPSGRH